MNHFYSDKLLYYIPTQKVVYFVLLDECIKSECHFETT